MTLQSCTSDLDVVADTKVLTSEELFATTAGYKQALAGVTEILDWYR
jgi:hypothetical protein